MGYLRIPDYLKIIVLVGLTLSVVQCQRYEDQNQQGGDNCCEEYCYYTDEEPYISLGTKSAYDSINNRRTSSQQHYVPECQPIQFWSINRHGTRLPSRNTIQNLVQLGQIHDEFVRNYQERRSYPDRGRLCKEDFDLLKSWRWNDTITPDRANSLTSQGVEDLKLLARRYRSKFSTLFNVPYSDAIYSFQYTDTDRTHDSYQAYIEGLFGNDAYQVHANVFQDDKLIKPYKSCDSWKNEVDDNPQTYSEYRRFIEKQEYRQMVRNVFRRLGFRYTLNATFVDYMYDMCRYEKAWYVERRSPWCVAFTENDLKLIEYGEDLKYYYKSGYGNEMNKNLGCPPLKDMYEKFDRTVSGNSDGNKVTVYFTHSTSILTFLTAMGVNRDITPLTADNYYQQTRRAWRTSNMDPFAANLAAILYQCKSGERHRVMFFLNEVPVEFPECSVGLCDWSTIQQKYQNLAENCNLDFCGGNTAAFVKINHVIYLLPFASVLLFYLKY